MLRFSPLRTVLATFTAHGSSKSLEDVLSQIANNPISLPPVDGGPVGLSLGSVCKRCRLHLTFPSICNRYYTLPVIHQVHVCTLSGWVSPYCYGLIHQVIAF